MKENLQAENLEEAIWKIVVFFDSFDYPLTIFEAWRFCEWPADFPEVHQVFSGDFLTARLSQSNGFYFLKGREILVEKRRKFSLLAEKKARRARMAIRLWRFVPGLKGVALCNNFYYREESDVDLFIVVADGYLWLTRFLVTVITHLAGLRPRHKKVADKICLSFFVSEKALDLSPLMISGGDPYFIAWFAFLDPIFNDGVFKKLWEDNIEIRKSLPNYSAPIGAPFRSLSWDVFKKFPLVSRQLFRSWQKKIIARKNISPDNEPGGVVVSDDVLKLHEHDRRREFRLRFENALRKKL